MIASIFAIILIGIVIWVALEIAVTLIFGLFIVAAFSSHTEIGTLIGIIMLCITVYALLESNK